MGTFQAVERVHVDGDVAGCHVVGSGGMACYKGGFSLMDLCFLWWLFNFSAMGVASFECDSVTALGCTEVVPFDRFDQVFEAVVLVYSLNGYGGKVGTEEVRGVMHSLGGFFGRVDGGCGVCCMRNYIQGWDCVGEGCVDCSFVLVVNRCDASSKNCSLGKYGLPRYVLRWERGGDLRRLEWLFFWYLMVKGL